VIQHQELYRILLRGDYTTNHGSHVTLMAFVRHVILWRLVNRWCDVISPNTLFSGGVRYGVGTWSISDVFIGLIYLRWDNVKYMQLFRKKSIAYYTKLNNFQIMETTENCVLKSC